MSIISYARSYRQRRLLWAHASQGLQHVSEVEKSNFSGFPSAGTKVAWVVVMHEAHAKGDMLGGCGLSGRVEVDLTCAKWMRQVRFNMALPKLRIKIHPG